LALKNVWKIRGQALKRRKEDTIFVVLLPFFATIRTKAQPGIVKMQLFPRSSNED
jgi:hypothetical protein